MIKETILSLSRSIIPRLPHGKSLAIDLTLRVCGSSYDGVVQVSDGRRFYVGEITPITRSLFFMGQYEPDETRLVSSIVRMLGDDAVYLDVGANFGWFTSLIGTQNRSSRVVAFELSTDISANLARTIELNNLKNVTLVNAALGDRDQDVEYYYFRDHATANLSPEELPNSTKKEIAMITTDGYCERECIKRVDMIKCDIDGAEVPFLQGAERTIGENKPIILIEAYEDGQRRQGHTCADIFDELRPLGYRFFFSDSLHAFEPETETFTRGYSKNILCIPQNRLDILPTLRLALPVSLS